MIKDALFDAQAAIRTGDKQQGKALLLDVLKEDPEHDEAWVWMGTVVDTDELRQECLEEALRCNPDNKTAVRELQKLQKRLAVGPYQLVLMEEGVEQFDPEPDHALHSAHRITISNDNQQLLEYMTKRLILEKWYSILVLDEAWTPAVIDFEQFHFSIPVDLVPELLPLQPHFDLILFRQTNAQFDFICLKVCRTTDEPAPVTQEQLVEAGRACLKYSTKSRYGVHPVMVQVWEIFERNFTPEDEQRLRSLKRLPGLKKVGIHAHAVDKVSQRVVYTSGRLKLNGQARYIQRLFDQRSQFSEEKLIEAIANSRMEILPIIAGIVVGVVLGIGVRLLAAALGWAYLLEFDIFIVFLVSSIAVYMPEFKFHTVWQGILASVGFGLTLYAILILLLGFEPHVGYAIFLGVFALWGRFIGAMANP